MKLYYGFPTQKVPAVVTLGMFDGVHLGHKQLLHRAVTLAKGAGLTPCVCTFASHPLSLVCPEHAPKLLTSPQMRAYYMGQEGIASVAMLPFTRQIADMEAEDFVRLLLMHYEMHIVVIGFNYTFGYKGMGTADFMKEMGKKYGFSVVVVKPVQIDGQPVSSTRIRGEISKGNMEATRRLLGRSFEICGKVIHGKHVGSSLGFPTANLHLPERRILPAFGVYDGLLYTHDSVYPCVINVGRHPTLPEGCGTVEAHVLDQTVDLYDKQVKIELEHFSRPEQKFETVELLRKQVEKDKEDARKYFKMV